MTKKWIFLLLFLPLAVMLDYWSKQWAVGSLDYGITEHAWNGILKLTLSFNRGAAFGVNIGSASRPIFIVFSAVTLVWLVVIYHRTSTRDWSRLLGIAMVCSGAIGNLTDRIKSAQGVVDFLGPYDLKFMLWPIFNVADIYVVIGIVLLFISMRSSGLHESSSRETHSNLAEGL